MRKFEDAMATPNGYLVMDLKSSTSEQNRLRTIIFDSINQQAPDEENMSDDDNASSVESLDYIRSISPPSKRRKLRDESYKQDLRNERVKFLDYISELSHPSK